MLDRVLVFLLLVGVVRGQGCPVGMYGDDCGMNCSRYCAPYEGQKVYCDKQTGRCSEGCLPGKYGDRCHLTCSKNCKKNICSFQTGHCVQGCVANNTGLFCETSQGPANVERGVRLNPADTDLHDACKGGNLKRVRGILHQSLRDIDKKGEDGMTPVMWAARRGHRELVDLLVKKGADLTFVDDVGNNILHWACFGENVAMVKHVVSKNNVDIKCRGRDGRTPLMWAARQGNLDMFHLLVSATGGLPAEVDREGNSILQLACWGGNADMVDYIISHDDVNINGRGQSGRTPLMAAAYKGHGEIFDLLVSIGADPTQLDEAGENVLHTACLGGHVDIVRRVLELDKLDINSRGQCHRTPLMIVARNGHKEIVDLLINKGADATPEDDDSNTILHHAAEGGNLEIVKHVLSLENVDINARNNYNETAAMLATDGSDVCNLLVSRGGIMNN